MVRAFPPPTSPAYVFDTHTLSNRSFVLQGCGASTAIGDAPPENNAKALTKENIEAKALADEIVTKAFEDVMATPAMTEILTDTANSSPASLRPPPLLFGHTDSGEGFDYRRFITSGDSPVSAWHDVPLFASTTTFHAVIEITKNTKAKMEMATVEMDAPIKQDVKKGKVRCLSIHAPSPFPHPFIRVSRHHPQLRDYAIPIEWNYGAFPQTWEMPDHVWAGLEELAQKGDNDPLDIVDLSALSVPCGSIIEVKLLGVLAMIDEGEVDWKCLVINVLDPLASKLNTLEDVEDHFPGQVARVREWFTWYKAIDGEPGDGPLGSNLLEGKEPNVFGFGGEAKGPEEAKKVVEETHASWALLLNGGCDKGKLNLTCNGAAMAQAKATAATSA